MTAVATVVRARLTTGAKGRVTLAVGNGRVHLDRRSEVVVSGARLELEAGGVYVADGEESIAVGTPSGAVIPVGTRFEVRTKAKQTTVAVDEGSVSLQPRASDAKDLSLTLVAGEAAKFKAGRRPRRTRWTRVGGAGTEKRHL